MIAWDFVLAADYEPLIAALGFFATLVRGIVRLAQVINIRLLYFLILFCLKNFGGNILGCHRDVVQILWGLVTLVLTGVPLAQIAVNGASYLEGIILVVFSTHLKSRVCLPHRGRFVFIWTFRRLLTFFDAAEQLEFFH